MRAKNEFRFLAEAYDTKLVLERIVDGKLMCPEACCGAPVVECTCGEDCPHCNCFMIHKAMKNKDFTDKLLKEGYDDSDAALWRKQMEMEPKKVSPEELERIKKQKPAPQGRLTMPGDKDRDDTHTLKEMQRDIMNGMTAKESMEGMGIHPANQKSLLAKYMEFSKGSEGPIETGFENNEEPRRGISGYEHKPDALVSARQAGAKHKPYVSFFVDNDGRKIAAVLGSDGKIARDEEGNIKKWPARNKKEAEAWMSANYENL